MNSTVRELRSGFKAAAGVRAAFLIAAIVLALTGFVSITMHLLGVAYADGSAFIAVVVAVAFIGAFGRAPKPTLVVFACYVLLIDTLRRYAGYSLNYVDEVAVPIMFAVTAWRERPWLSGLVEPLREGAVVAVLALATAASLVNGVPAHVWLPGLLLLAKIFGFFYVVVWQRFTIDDLRGYSVFALALAGPIIGLGYIEAINPTAFREFLGLSGVGAARGILPSVKSITFHPVIYGWIGGWLSLWLAAYYVVYRKRWLLIGSMLAAGGTFLSARRRAILGLLAGLAAGLVATAARAWRASIRRWAPVAVGLLVLTIVFSPGIATLAQLTARDYVDPSLVPPPTEGQGEQQPQRGEAARIVIYVRSVDVAWDYFPLGAGLGRYGSWMSRVEYSPLYERYGLSHLWGMQATGANFITDTFWPQILGETGYLGLGAFVLFVLLVGVGLWRAARRPQLPFARAFALGAFMLFVHAVVETSASPMFASGKRTYIVLGAAGIAISMLRDAQGVRRESPALSLAPAKAMLRQAVQWTTARPYLVVAVSLMAWAVLIVAARFWVSDFYVHMATVHALANDLALPRDPMVGVVAGSAYFTPYTVALALPVAWFGLPPLIVFEVAALLNFALLLFAVARFSRHINTSPWMAVVGLATMGLLWGLNSPTWSGFYDLGSVSFTMPYPSLFATGLMFLAWDAYMSFRQGGRLLHLVALIGLGVVLTLAHPWTGLAAALGVVGFQLARPSSWGLPESLRLAAGGAIALFLVAAWPYYDLVTLVSSTGAYAQVSEPLVENLTAYWGVGKYGLALVGIPALVLRWQRPLGRELVVVFGLSAALIAGGLAVGASEVARLIPLAALPLHLSLAAFLVEAWPQIRARQPKLVGYALVTIAALAIGLVGARHGIAHAWSPRLGASPTTGWWHPDVRRELTGIEQHVRPGDVAMVDDRDLAQALISLGVFVQAPVWPDPFIADEAERRAAWSTFWSADVSADVRVAIADAYDVRCVVAAKSPWVGAAGALPGFGHTATLGAATLVLCRSDG